MAHTICGIDLGAYSVKFAFFEVGFRATTLRGLRGDRRCPPATRRCSSARWTRSARGCRSVAGEVTPYLALPGDQLSVRVLELPFSDARKIDQVVGYELEGADRATRSRTSSSITWSSAQRPEGSTVLAAAAKRDDLAAFIAAAEAQRHPPARAVRGAGHLPDAVAGRARRSTTGAPAPCQAVLDFGHQRTNVCFVRGGKPIYARTIRRGGAHLTAAIAKAFNADRERAEQAKRGEAFLASPGRPATTPLAASSSTPCCARRWRRPSASCARRWPASRASAKLEIDALLVVGGGGRLAGLLPFLEAELGIPARHPVGARALIESGGRHVGARSGRRRGGRARVGRARAGRGDRAGGGRAARARSTSAAGPFVYRASFSILRQKAAHLAALAAALLLAGGIDVGAKYSQPRAPSARRWTRS